MNLSGQGQRSNH